MKFKVSAILPLPADVYFVERDSAAFRSLVAQMCKLESLEIGDSWLDGDAEVYEFVTRPDIEKYVPQQFKHFLPGGDLHYTDIIEYHPVSIAQSPYKMKVRSIPPIFARKAKIESTLTIEEVTSETCRQTLEGVVEIKILGLGHIAERIVVDNLKAVYKGIPKIVDRWAQVRREVLKQNGGRDILIAGRPKNSGVDWINDKIRELIVAPESNSESISAASTPTTNELERLPSVQEMLQQCSVSSASVASSEDEVFFDARENASWADLNAFMSSDPNLDRNMRRDSRDAHELLINYTKSGRRLRKLQVDAPPLLTSQQSGQLKAKASGRFSADYNSALVDWKDFWQEHRVPEARHTSQLRKRLANLFSFGAAAGMFKSNKEHKKKQRPQKDYRRSASAADRTSHRRAGSHVSEGGEPSESSSSTSSKQEGHKGSHRRSRSAGIVKDLFTRISGLSKWSEDSY